MMVIKYNPYGWEIRPLRDELHQTIEEEFEIARLEKKIRGLLEKEESILESLFQYEGNPIFSKMMLERVLEEIQKLTDELIVKNLKLYGVKVYG